MEDTIIAPRIVQPRPWRAITLLLIVLLGMAAAAYSGFEFGRRQAPGTGLFHSDDLAPLRGRIAELEAENAALWADLQAMSSAQDDQPPATDEPPRPLEETETEADANEPEAEAPQGPEQPQQPLSSPGAAADASPDAPAGPQAEAITAVAAAPVETAGDAPNPRAKTSDLEIQSFQLRPSDSANLVRYSFVVGLADEAPGTVLGSIWIGVNGRSDGKPVRLRLREASREESDFVRMRFKLKQPVEGEFVLPEGFSPKSVIVEAKPLEEDKYRAAANTFDWILSDG